MKINSVCQGRYCTFGGGVTWLDWQMARYHFRLVDKYDVLRKLLTAELDNYEEVLERAELLAQLLISAEIDSDSNGGDVREILVTDDNGNDVLVVRISDVKRNMWDN